jgi:hypothetical protein
LRHLRVTMRTTSLPLHTIPRWNPGPTW